MKKSTIFVPVIMVALLGLGWFAYISGIINTKEAYNTCLENAQNSIDAGLYEQAIEYYKDALMYDNSEQLHMTIKETYDLLYAEEHISYIRNCYLDDLAIAAQYYPENEVFWTKQVELYLETDNYKKAYNAAKKAKNNGISGETLDGYYQELLYKTELGHKEYSQVVTNLNGYNNVYDGVEWKVVDDQGEELVGEYTYIGMLNGKGKGVYVSELGCRLLDINQVARAKFDVPVEEAGYYSESAGLIPVKVNGLWKYMNEKGEFLPGTYEIAGSYNHGQAAGRANGIWYLVDTAGNATATSFEDIKLDLYVCHIQNGIILAKENGKYHLYDTELQQIGDFSADEVDSCISTEGFAFRNGDKWGYADCEGNVIVEPCYTGAKSFANGYAAVCNEDSLWGVINSSYELVIDCEYVDVSYFNSSETCWVSTGGGTVRLLKFMF